MATASYLIYALVDPRSGEWRYIGKSSSGMARPRAHRAPSNLARNANPHKCNWIRQLHAAGLRYHIDVLEAVQDPAQLDEAEREWIAAARAVGVNLTNEDDGGTGRTPGFTTSEETRAKMSSASRGRHKNDAHRATLSRHLSALNRSRAGTPLSVETRARMSRAGKGRIVSSATRERLRVANTGRIHSADTRALISRKRMGHKLTAENRVKRSRVRGGRPFVDQNGTSYETQREASRLLGISQGSISDVLAGRQRSTRGFTFRYLEAT